MNCPFCNAPLAPHTAVDSWTPVKCTEGHEFQLGDALDGVQPHVPGWIYTNMQTATNLLQGRHIYLPWLCDPELPEDNAGDTLAHDWRTHEYRRACVHWVINCPVPKTVLEQHMRQLEVKMQSAAEQIGTMRAQMREHHGL